MKKPNQHIEMILSRLPNEPGIYQYFNSEGEIIYVGKAKNLKRRVSSYFQKQHEWNKTRQLVNHIADIKYVVVGSEQDAFLLENNLIKQYQPKYNILLKDGKSYPSICISREDYPKVFKTRKIIKEAGEYYGPYSYGDTVDLVIELIHQLYPIRTCSLHLLKNKVKDNHYKVCLKYHLGKCSGICEGEVTDDQYAQYIDEARKIIRGDAHQVARTLEKEMELHASKMEYEKAAEIKQKLDLISKFCSKTVITNTHAGDVDVFGYDEQDMNVYINMLHVHNGSITQGQTIEYTKQVDEDREELLAMGMVELRKRLQSTTQDVLVPFIPVGFDENLHIHIAISGDKKKLLDLAEQNVKQYKMDRLKQSDKLNPDQIAARVLGKLQTLLKLDKMPMMIDSFDNSNIQGTDAVASCVVFRKAKPSKKEYKKFKIQSVQGPDDYASMREIVRRRYSDIVEQNGELPGLIIADGGIGQMNAIREVVEQQLGLSIPVAGLKKDSHHKTNVLIYGDPPMEISMKVTDEVFRLLVMIQEEVHRFAISYHKLKRSQRQTSSQLDDIQGVGEKTKVKILTHFKSIARAKRANLDEWQQLLGKSLGSTCYEYFNSKISL